MLCCAVLRLLWSCRPGSHLFRDPKGLNFPADAEAFLSSPWARARCHPLTGEPLRVVAPALPPGSIACCLSHSAHGVAPKADSATTTRWCSLFSYRTGPAQSGLDFITVD